MRRKIPKVQLQNLVSQTQVRPRLPEKIQSYGPVTLILIHLKAQQSETILGQVIQILIRRLPPPAHLTG